MSILPDKDGGHLYEQEGGHLRCYRCTSTMSAYKSSSPEGVDAFGKCPGNPLNANEGGNQNKTLNS